MMMGSSHVLLFNRGLRPVERGQEPKAHAENRKEL